MKMDEVIGRLSQALQNLGGLGQGHSKVDQITEGNIATDMAQAMSEFGFRYGEDALFCYDGCRYVKLTDREVNRVIFGVLLKLDIGIVYRTKSIETISKLILRSPNILEFKPSKGVISFKNCVLTLDDMKAHEHSSEWMTRIHLDHDYDAKAKCPEWRKFLTEVISDENSIMVLQEFFGLMFVDRSDLKVAVSMFLFGQGANGKTVLADTINYIIGKENYSSFSISQLCTDRDAGYNTAIANGKLLNTASDMGDKDFSGGQYKAITSYDPIMARPIGAAPFTADDMPLMLSLINKMPVTTDSTNGYWRRNKIIKFEKTFDESIADGYIELRLRAEASGIFNWMMEGRERIIKSRGKFTVSDMMEKTNREMRKNSSSVLSFLEEKRWVGKLAPGQAGHEDRAHAKDMYIEYKDYCQLWGNQAKSKNNFFDDLRQNGFKYNPTLRVFGKGTSTGWTFYVVDNKDGDELGQREQEDDFFDSSQELPF